MHPASKLAVKCALGLSLSVLPLTAVANDAVILLNQMYEALHKLEYRGKLVYIKDGEATNLSVRHVFEDGVEREIIVPLDENSDEYVKESAGFSLTSIPRITPQMQEVYSFDLGGMGKVAGRPCRIVVIRPKDRMRYLQKYCIDLDRSVLLKFSLINQYHKPVERFMFTDFEVISAPQIAEEPAANDAGEELLDDLTLDALVSDGETTKSAGTVEKMAARSALVNGLAAGMNEFTSAPQARDASAGAEDAALESVLPANSGPDNYSEWFFDPLPPGFFLVPSGHLNNTGNTDEQVIISDGLSSVSVFISDNKGENKHYRAVSSGALNILTRVTDGHYVTLVGEVPKSTLENIFTGLKRATIKE